MSVWPQLGIAPGPVCRVYGMRRSGNHAIINWLQRNAPGGRALFFNDCRPGRDPFATFRAAEIDGRRVAGPGADPARLGAQAGAGALVLFSYEDAMPNAPRKRALSEGIDEAEIAHEIVISRSFLNWSASLLKKLQGNPAYRPPQRVAIVLRALTGYERMLDLVIHEDDLDVVTIRFDDWAGSPAYRAGRLARLGFPARDDTLGEVQPYGDGSSFQKTAQRPEELRIAGRWRQMAQDPQYRTVLWLAAQDTEFQKKLSRVYPEDAARLASLAGDPARWQAASNPTPASETAPAEL